MPTRHEVKAGECISSIAFEHGLYWETIWNHPANSGLKGQRPDPHALLAGDVLSLPAGQAKIERCKTGVKHVFKRKGAPVKFRLRLVRQGAPRAGLPYRLEIDGRLQREGKTDADGLLEQWIPPNAVTGVLRIGKKESYELSFGRLDPVESDSGVRSRLANLRYLARVDCSEELLAAGLRAFQLARALEPTGLADEATRSALLQQCGS